MRAATSRFLDDLARTHVWPRDLVEGYRAMAADEARGERPRNGARILPAMSPKSRDNPPRRGEVWWVAFDPGRGGEFEKIGPAVIISNDIGNRELNRLQVVPLTTNVARL